MSEDDDRPFLLSPSVSPPPSLRSLRSLRSSGYETRVKWNGTETKEPGKERRSGGLWVTSYRRPSPTVPYCLRLGPPYSRPACGAYGTRETVE